MLYVIMMNHNLGPQICNINYKEYKYYIIIRDIK